MILVDSSVWIDFFNGQETRETGLLNSLLAEQPLLIGDLIVTEVLQGFRSDKAFERAREALEVLDFATIGGPEIALASAANYRTLRKQGVILRKTIDILIGTFYIENRHTLLQTDQDFEPMVKLLGLKAL